jgi:alanine-synthesizing transaminase
MGLEATLYNQSSHAQFFRSARRDTPRALRGSMFERYTEKARRVIFFARYEASPFGSPYIETEHLLLGLLREDKALTNRFLRSHASVESIRKQIEGHTTIREKVSTSVDLPLSNECKRVLAYAAEEAERLSHKHVGTEHLLLGLLREEKCFAAEILHERGLRLSAIREELSRTSQEKSQPSQRDPESSQRTSWDFATNRYTEALDAHRKAGREVLDLTASNPTVIGLHYREDELLRALAHREALIYEPQPKGLLSAREVVAAYYAERDSHISPDDVILTTSTSEAYSFVFRLLCDPGDAVLAPTPSYPLLDFLADLHDVKLMHYELVYDHGWQIDFSSLHTAIDRARAAGAICRAVLVVHPNNPTGSYVKPHEADQLNRICADNRLAIIADEVFLDYALGTEPLTFSSNRGALTFTLSGLSKISGLPQMKVAWVAVSGPEARKAEALRRLELIADTYLSMNAPVQLAVPVLLEERHGIHRQLMYRIRENLAELDSQLAAQTFCQRLEVDGGWYAVLRVPVTGSDEDLAIRLLEETGVLVQPGHFYDFPADGHLVLSLITESQVFRKGIQRMLQLIAAKSG